MKNIEEARKRRSFLSITILTILTLLLLGAMAQVQAQWTANGNDINNTNSGNVGIGIAPSFPLEVKGTTPTSVLRLGSTNAGIGSIIDMDANAYGAGGNNWRLISGGSTTGPGSAWASLFLIRNETNTINALAINSSGNVGIGTTSPGAKLEVSAGYLRVLGAGTAVTPPASGSGLEMVWDNTNSIGYLQSYDHANSAYHKISIDASTLALNPNSAGNVGIGTTNPTYKLDVTGTAHVSGNVTIDGNINAKYQDVAEWVPSTHALSAGTVVILNPNKSNEVMASESAYDTRVAGVVSERPGLSLGEAGKDKALVATTGRVKVKVDATRAPIHVGDLLVTSDVEGIAMKSEPVDLGGVKLHRPGTLIGKALENLEKGKGEILVLLSLQ